MNFDNMLNEAYSLLGLKEENNKLILPDLLLEYGTTKVHWINIEHFLKTINRPSNHFIKWLNKEIPNININWLSNLETDGLLLHNKNIKKDYLINILLKYINNYVICSSCKSYNTIIQKNNKQYEFICLNCEMKKYI